MKSTLKREDGRAIVQLRDSEIDPANQMRDPEEVRHLERLLTNLFPRYGPHELLELDLLNLTKFRGWERCDVAFVVKMASDAGQPKLTVHNVSHPRWRAVLMQEYRQYLEFKNFFGEVELGWTPPHSSAPTAFSDLAW